MKGKMNNGLGILIIWGIYFVLSKVSPLRVLWMLPMSLMLATLLNVTISVVYFTVAYIIATKLIMKRRSNILKAIIISAVAAILFQLLRSFLFRIGFSVMIVNLFGLAYGPLCAALSLMGRCSVAGNEGTTLYRKEGVIQKGSPAYNMLQYVFIFLWLMGAFCVYGSTIVQPRDQAPAFLMIGLVCLVIAVIWTIRKVNNRKIANYDKIVTPAHWPQDCQYADYNMGLNSKKQTAKNSKELRFYQNCVAENVMNLDGARNQQKALLVAAKMNVPEESILAAYEKGRQEQAYNTSLSANTQRNQELAKIRIQELDVLAGAMKYYGIHGREKRVAMLRDMYEDAKKKMKDAKFMQEYAQRNMLQKEHDWAIHGGIANGIAGPAAGIVTAMRVEAKNAAIREYNAQMAPYAAMVSQSYSKTAAGYESMMTRYNLDIERTRTKLLLEAAPQEIYRHLRIENMSYAISETGAVAIEADFSVDSNYRIYEDVAPAIDGVVAARLLENGVHVGSAYFVFPVDGVHKKVRLASICTRTTKPNAQYTVDYAPVDLWAIEKMD